MKESPPKKEMPSKKSDQGERATPKRIPEKVIEGAALLRIAGQDIPTNKNIFTGLTMIKGISWSLSNAICLHLGLKRETKIEALSKEDIARIERFLVNPTLPRFLKNRRSDRESGTDQHLFTNALDIRREFDIKRLKQIKSYRGIRHALGQPVRGQRTRSHFRKKGGAMAVKKRAEKA